jgi:hypothetical protein
VGALFEEVRTTAALPAVGVSAETTTLDFKAVPPRSGDSFDRREMAKDVVMFANANGGVLIVGACETDGRLAAYRPLPEEDIPRIKAAYETAARDLCSPVPVLDVVPIGTLDGTGTVLAVNVLAFPGSPVGVQWLNDGGVLIYAFPIRVGTHTKWLRAEQLPMIMVPEIRRKVILLDSIPAAERNPVVLIGQRGKLPTESFQKEFRLKEVDPVGGSITLSQGGGPAPEYSFSLPIDAVTMVWKNGGRWRIAFQGRIDSGQYLPTW